MKKKAEILQKIEMLRGNILDCLQTGKIDEAKKANDELTILLDEAEKIPAEQPKGAKVMDKKEMLNKVKKAVNSFIHKGWRGMSDEERTVLNATDTPGQVEVATSPSRGSVLVPVETADFVGRMATGVYRLRTRVDEYFANTLSGKIPLMANPTAGLVAQFDEFPASGINKGQLTFGSVDWTVRDYGLIIPVSNDLIEDANADVYGVIAEQFARAQVITENQMILAAIDGNGAGTTVTDWKGILSALNETDPVGSPEKVIVTNSDGYSYLDELTDDQGRPILTQALVDDPRRIFRGYEVIQLPNAILPTDESDGIPFYVGDLRSGVYFIERKGLTFAYNPYSDSAYSKNAVDIRVTCRLDCKSKFPTAVKKLFLDLE